MRPASLNHTDARCKSVGTGWSCDPKRIIIKVLNKRDPKICSDKREKQKKDHYSEFYDQDCYTLATVAIGSFGYLGG